MRQSYEVKLDAFEGPLDLLLHLIHQYEIDIYDIPVAEITEQYMAYIHELQEFELNIASEYLVMASTLLVLKSQMLLPKAPFQEEDEYEEDPRGELIQRLIEYKKYKEAARQLEEKEQGSFTGFTRLPVPFDESMKTPTIEQNSVSIYDMLAALGNVFDRKKFNEPIETTVQRTGISIEERMQQVLESAREHEDGIRFDNLFAANNRLDIVVTFMAILELMKVNKIKCSQTRHFDTIMIYAGGA